MGKYGPKPIHEIAKFRRLGRNALMLLVVVGLGLAYASRDGAIELRPWFIALGLVAAGAGLGLWNATAIVRRADEVYEPGVAVRFAPVLAVGLAAAGLGVLRTTVGASHQLFFMLAGAAGFLAYLATLGCIAAFRLRAITSGEREWPWPSTLD